MNGGEHTVISRNLVVPNFGRKAFDSLSYVYTKIQSQVRLAKNIYFHPILCTLRYVFVGTAPTTPHIKINAYASMLWICATLR